MAITVVGAVAAPRADYSHDLGVFIGRFQPFHHGHLFIIREALRKVRFLTVLVGSSRVPRSYFNPFTFEERKAMILGALTEDEQSRVFVQPLVDMTYNDGAWVLQVQERAADAIYNFGRACGFKPNTALVGHQKDGSSFYLKMFPQWGEIALPSHKNVSATNVRERYFLSKSLAQLDLLDKAGGSEEDLEYFYGKWKAEYGKDLPLETVQFLAGFFENASEDFFNIREEYLYVQKYKSQFEGLAYPPIFQTVDAVVVQSGHILLVKRKSRPGRGLWALPGGFLNATARVQDAVYRELREETKIKVPEAVLRGSTITNRLFDDVHRSARGRTLTHAYLIKLPDGPLPKVKGADHAEKAKWVPLAEVTRDVMFEDHHAIITNLTALI